MTLLKNKCICALFNDKPDDLQIESSDYESYDFYDTTTINLSLPYNDNVSKYFTNKLKYMFCLLKTGDSINITVRNSNPNEQLNTTVICGVCTVLELDFAESDYPLHIIMSNAGIMVIECLILDLLIKYMFDISAIIISIQHNLISNDDLQLFIKKVSYALLFNQGLKKIELYVPNSYGYPNEPRYEKNIYETVISTIKGSIKYTFLLFQRLGIIYEIEDIITEYIGFAGCAKFTEFTEFTELTENMFGNRFNIKFNDVMW